MYNNFFPPPIFGKKQVPFNKQHVNQISKQHLDSVKPKSPVPENFSQPDVLFEIFGIKIYFDDFLLICILIFLYQEGIDDEYLFIALIFFHV